MSSSSTPLTFGTLVVFTDGTVRAGRVTRDQLSEQLDQVWPRDGGLQSVFPVRGQDRHPTSISVQQRAIGLDVHDPVAVRAQQFIEQDGRIGAQVAVRGHI